MIIDIFELSLMVTSFVLIMMLLIEYVNVQTKGNWQYGLVESRWKQYFLGALLGATPGCLGAFTAVSLYEHRVISMGAIVTTMIATSGDEAFVMFSLFPAKALLIIVILVFIGLIAGVLTDILGKTSGKINESHEFHLHEKEICNCFPRGEILY